MSDILCSWLNKELRLSKSVGPNTFSKDFSSGYLIGEVLHKYQLQDDFSMFIKTNTSNSKLNNFTRLEPTLQLLGVPFDLTTAQALMQEQHGAATRLLYQLYVLLQKKKKAGITGTAMEAMQPAGAANLHKIENEIYSDRLRTVVRRDAELKLQKISQRYEDRAQQWNDKSVMAQLVQHQKKLKVQEEMRMRDIEKLRASRRGQNEIMARIQASIVQVPKPPPDKSLHNLDKRQQQQQLRREQQAQKVQAEIAQFEKSRKKLVTSDFPSSSSSGQSLSLGCMIPSQKVPGGRAEVVLQSNSEYIQRIRERLEEDASARQQREKRRRKFLMEQLMAHEAQEEALRDEQLAERLTRQTQHERRLAVQLLQMRMQKEVIRENRLFRERQHQQQRERDFQDALEREAALARQAKLDHAEEIRKEIELHNRIAGERAQNRYRKHFKSCREVLEQIVDLATKVGEYRLLTGNLIPVKLMMDWKELLFGGLPLYEPEATKSQQPGSEPPAPPDPVELEKQEILNNQDYDEYTNMVGEWAWPEEAGETRAPPDNNRILGHVVLRLKNIVHPPNLGTPTPSFPHFTLKACVLGKLFSGKTTCLTKITQVHGIHVLSADTLIQEALVAYQNGEELSARALHGSAVERVLRKGEAVPDELLVGIIVEAIRQLPAPSGWILDGSPANVTQARLLEAALGGSAGQGEETADRKKRSSRTKLAVDPNAPGKPPPPPPVLDLALLLDVSDECVLSRAAEQARAEESVLQGGDEPTFSPAVEGSETARETVTTTLPVPAASGVGAAAAAAEPGTRTDSTAAATAVPHRDKSLEKRHIQHRITAFQDTWSNLEKWFGRKQSILVHLDAAVKEEELYRRVESVLQQTMMQKQKGNWLVTMVHKCWTVGKCQRPLLQTQTQPQAQLHIQTQPRAQLHIQTQPRAQLHIQTQPRAQLHIQTQPRAQLHIQTQPRAQLHIQTQPWAQLHIQTQPQAQLHIQTQPQSSSSLNKEPALTVKSHSTSNTHSPRGRSRRVSVSSVSNENSQGGPRSPSESASPCPGSASWVYVDEPLPPEIPQYLCPYWDSVCESYVSSVKAVMQNLRSERILIIRHLFNIREEYKHYLGRPDLKQEFVCQWQQDYNSVPDDMRDDEETKAELHQRLDDLRERLWDICDKRREEDGQERAALMGDGWLDDHTGVLINHYSTLVQVEVDRFQDTLCILKDYYLGMYKQELPEPPPDFTCIPLLDITDTEDTPQEDSTEQVTGSDCGKRDDGDDRRKTKVRPPSSEVVSKQGGLQQEDPDKTSEEKHISDIYQAALTTINHLVSAEAHQKEVEMSEESQRQEDKDRVEKASQASASGATKGKDRKKSSGRKKGRSSVENWDGYAAPSPPPEPSPPPTVEESSEEVHKRQVRGKIRKEYAAALDHEERAALVRTGLVRGRALVMVRSLQRRAEQIFSSMEECLAARYLAEMNSIDRLAEVVRHHIESGSKLQSELVLERCDFYLNGDVRLLASPPPPPRPDPLERPTHATLTVAQLDSLYQQLCHVAPTGLMSGAELSDVLQDIISLNMGCDSLPEPWISMDGTQLTEMISLLTRESQLLDWRRFLLSAALPWPLPSLTQLLLMVRRFRTADTQNTGYVNQQQYLKIELWFPSEAQPVPEDPNEPLPYDRLANLRKFFFQLFADRSSAPPRLDYVSMLQYLSAHPDPAQGFIRALSVVLGQHLKHPSASRLVKSIPNIEEAAESPDLGGEEEQGEGEGTLGASSGVLGDPGVSIPALLAVICHKGTETAGHARFQSGCKSLEEHAEGLVRIFAELGYTPEDHVPFSILCQHALAQELMECSPYHQLIDVHSVLRSRQTEGETQSSKAS
ncbi:sperm flagellar protein 2 [Polymixia lowei]